MKKLLPLIIVMGFAFLVSCGKEFPAQKDEPTLLGTWEMVSFYNSYANVIDGTIISEGNTDKTELIWRMQFIENGEGFGYEEMLITNKYSYSYDFLWILFEERIHFFVGEEHEIRWTADQVTYPILTGMTFTVKRLTVDELVLTFRETFTDNVDGELVERELFYRCSFEKLN